MECAKQSYGEFTCSSGSVVGVVCQDGLLFHLFVMMVSVPLYHYVLYIPCSLRRERHTSCVRF